MNALEAIKKAKLLLSQGKAISIKFPNQETETYDSNQTDTVAKHIGLELYESPDGEFEVSEVPTELTASVLAQVWDKVKPTSSPVAAENKFFARIVEELTAKGLL